MKNKKSQWDGKSRVSNDNYRKRWEEIFSKEGSIINLEESFKSKKYLKEEENEK